MPDPDPAKESEQSAEIADQVRRSLIQMADMRDAEEKLREIAKRASKNTALPPEKAEGDQ